MEVKEISYALHPSPPPQGRRGLLDVFNLLNLAAVARSVGDLGFGCKRRLMLRWQVNQ